MYSIFYGIREILSDLPLLFTAPTHQRETRAQLIKQAYTDTFVGDWRSDKLSAAFLNELFEVANERDQPQGSEAPLCVYVVQTDHLDNGAIWSGLVRGWHLKKLKRLKRKGMKVIAACVQRDWELWDVIRDAQARAERPISFLNIVAHGAAPFSARPLSELAEGAHVLLECCEAGAPYGVAQDLADLNPSTTVWAHEKCLGNTTPYLKVKKGRVEIHKVLCMITVRSLVWGEPMRRFRSRFAR
jgi:hypothetical protein